MGVALFVAGTARPGERGWAERDGRGFDSHPCALQGHRLHEGAARLDDLIDVRCRISEKKRASFRFAYEIRNERDEVVATGFTLHACQDPATAKLVAVPAWLGAAMTLVYNS